MSDNSDNAAKEVVEQSKVVTITIAMNQRGDIQVEGPFNRAVMMLGMLEAATETVHEVQREGRKKKEQSNIVIPTIVPKRPM